MYSTHKKGILGELEFALHLIKNGYTVLQPMNPNSSYDLVIEKDGNFQRIQVKYLTPRHGLLRVELERPKRSTASYRDRDVDAFGIYNPTQQKYYLIPMAIIASKTEFWLRLNRPKNEQVKNVHFAEKFEI
jgi:hypothetical protein